MDKVTLFSQALHKIGQREYFRDTPSGKECDLWFPQVLHEALLFGRWSFATRETTLQSDTPFRFQLPADCIRVLKVGAPRFRLIGRELIIEEHPALRDNRTLPLTYLSDSIARQEHLPDTEPMFCKGVMLLLAARIAPKLTSNPQLAASLDQDASETLRRALHENAVQQWSNDQHPLKDILNSALF